jgi:hypothetical protein
MRRMAYEHRLLACAHFHHMAVSYLTASCCQTMYWSLIVIVRLMQGTRCMALRGAVQHMACMLYQAAGGTAHALLSSCAVL